MQYPVSIAETGMDREDRPVFRGVDDLLPDVKYLLPKCDAEITIRKTLAEQAQEFCRTTGCLTHRFDLTVVTGTVQYELATADVNADLLCVNRVSLWRIPAGGTVAQYSSDLNPGTDFDIEDPLDEDHVYLNLRSSYSAPVDGSTLILRAEVSLIPYFDQSVGTQAYAFPDKFLRRWRQALVSGAVAKLASMEKTPWFNSGLAADRQKTYDSLVGEAQNKANFNQMASGSYSAVNPIGFV